MKKRSLGFLEGMWIAAAQPVAEGGMKFLDWERAKRNWWTMEGEK